MFQVQATPKRDSGNSLLWVEKHQLRWGDLGECDLRLAQAISIPDLPEIGPIGQESGLGTGGNPSSGGNAGNGGNRGGIGGSGRANNYQRHQPRGEKDEVDGRHEYRERDNDDDD